MNRYYKHYGESLEGVGTVYLETEGDVVVRQVEVYGDRRFWSNQHTQSDITHRICDRPVSELRLTRADQTTPKEFEAVWRRARQDAQEISPDEEA
jgi:hypothetical protein